MQTNKRGRKPLTTEERLERAEKHKVRCRDYYYNRTKPAKEAGKFIDELWTDIEKLIVQFHYSFPEEVIKQKWDGIVKDHHLHIEIPRDRRIAEYIMCEYIAEEAAQGMLINMDYIVSLACDNARSNGRDLTKDEEMILRSKIIDMASVFDYWTIRRRSGFKI